MGREQIYNFQKVGPAIHPLVSNYPYKLSFSYEDNKKKRVTIRAVEVTSYAYTNKTNHNNPKTFKISLFIEHRCRFKYNKGTASQISTHKHAIW